MLCQSIGSIVNRLFVIITGAFYTAEGYKTIAIYDGVDFDDSEVIELRW